MFESKIMAYPGFEDVIDNVDDAVGRHGIAFENLRVVDEVVEAVE